MTAALPDGPFRGVPFLVKDLGCEMAGEPHTLRNRWIPDHSTGGSSGGPAAAVAATAPLQTAPPWANRLPPING